MNLLQPKNYIENTLRTNESISLKEETSQHFATHMRKFRATLPNTVNVFYVTQEDDTLTVRHLHKDAATTRIHKAWRDSPLTPPEEQPSDCSQDILSTETELVTRITSELKQISADKKTLSHSEQTSADLNRLTMRGWITPFQRELITHKKARHVFADPEYYRDGDQTQLDLRELNQYHRALSQRHKNVLRQPQR